MQGLTCKQKATWRATYERSGKEDEKKRGKRRRKSGLPSPIPRILRDRGEF